MVSASSSSSPRRPRRRVIVQQDSNENVDDAMQISSPPNLTVHSNLDPDIEDELFGDAQSDFAEEDEEGDVEDLFGDDMELDYAPAPHLDVYESDMLDENSEISEISIGARREAEREMQRRDRIELAARGEGGPAGALLYDESDISDSQPGERRRLRTRTKQRRDGAEPELSELSHISVPEVDVLKFLRSLKTLDPNSASMVHNRIGSLFKGFLQTYRDAKGQLVYPDKIRQMCQANKESLTVSFEHLASERGELELAYVLPEYPCSVLPSFDKVAKEMVLKMYPKYERIAPNIHVRISNLPLEEQIRGLRHIHLNQLIKICGVVTTITGIIPQLSVIKYDCLKCGYLLGPFVQTAHQEVRPGFCPNCQSAGPFDVNDQETIYQNYQCITVQESPNKVAAGRIPRSKECILLADLCDSCKPGDEIELTGIYTHNYDGSLNAKHGFPVFATVMLANHVSTNEDKTAVSSLTDDDVDEIMRLSADPNVTERIFASIAPSIYGHESIKRALALALVGGEVKNPGKKHRIRGDINLLLCGDPGTAKSQFLRYIASVASRGVLTTGQGASAVGLTAHVLRHPVTQEWTLEAGALVLADKGICLIDEFDKMNDRDRTSIHEAMEQQTITIAKAGIVTSLQARCSVIAASNPISGRYDASRTFAENVDLSEPIISRFDILCVVRDNADTLEDERLARFVVHSHMRHHPDAASSTSRVQQATATQSQDLNESRLSVGDDSGRPELVDQKLLKKYLMYARENVHPTLSQMDQNKVAKVYADLRMQSEVTSSAPVTVRLIESIIRLSEASAKLRLHNYVSADDVSMAIEIMVDAFVNTQKYSVMKQMKRKFSKYLNFKQDNNHLLLYMLKQCVNEQLRFKAHRLTGDQVYSLKTIEVHEMEFLEKAKTVNVENLTSFYKSDLFQSNRFTYDRKKRLIVHTL